MRTMEHSPEAGNTTMDTLPVIILGGSDGRPVRLPDGEDLRFNNRRSLVGAGR